MAGSKRKRSNGENVNNSTKGNGGKKVSTKKRRGSSQAIISESDSEGSNIPPVSHSAHGDTRQTGDGQAEGQLPFNVPMSFSGTGQVPSAYDPYHQYATNSHTSVQPQFQFQNDHTNQASGAENRAWPGMNPHDGYLIAPTNPVYPHQRTEDVSPYTQGATNAGQLAPAHHHIGTNTMMNDGPNVSNSMNERPQHQSTSPQQNQLTNQYVDPRMQQQNQHINQYSDSGAHQQNQYTSQYVDTMTHQQNQHVNQHVDPGTYQQSQYTNQYVDPRIYQQNQHATQFSDPMTGRQPVFNAGASIVGNHQAQSGMSQLNTLFTPAYQGERQNAFTDYAAGSGNTNNRAGNWFASNNNLVGSACRSLPVNVRGPDQENLTSPCIDAGSNDAVSVDTKRTIRSEESTPKLSRSTTSSNSDDHIDHEQLKRHLQLAFEETMRKCGHWDEGSGCMLEKSHEAVGARRRMQKNVEGVEISDTNRSFVFTELNFGAPGRARLSATQWEQDWSWIREL